MHAGFSLDSAVSIRIVHVDPRLFGKPRDPHFGAALSYRALYWNGLDTLCIIMFIPFMSLFPSVASHMAWHNIVWHGHFA